MTNNISARRAAVQVPSVAVHVPDDHPLLLLKRSLDWDALTAVVKERLRVVGCNVDGALRGRRIDVGALLPSKGLAAGQCCHELRAT